MASRQKLQEKPPRPDRRPPPAQAFPELDVEKIRNTLDLAKIGRERGEKNLPAEASETLDDIEQRIVKTIEADQLRQQQSLNDQLKTYNQSIAGLDIENEAATISGAAQRASSEFTVKANEGKAHLFTLWRNVCMVEQQWNDFRKKHGLRYPADYPLSRLWNFAIIAVILGVESILNGNFLARGLETGFIGGIIQAFVIAAINVLFGFFLGDSIIRYVIHRNYILRTLAIIELPISCGIAVAFNLLVGHYRNALGGPDPMHASAIAWNTFTTHPFALEAFQSWILFAMGLFFYVVAAADGFKMDDPYPGYGKINRKHEEILQEYSDEKANIIDDLSRTRDRAMDYIQNTRQNLAEKTAELSSLLDARAWLIRHFEAHESHLDRALNDLLSTYRHANMAARTAPPPLRFTTSQPLPRLAPLAPPSHAINQKVLEVNIEKTNEALVTAIAQVNAKFEEAAKDFQQVGEFLKGGDDERRVPAPT